MCCLVSLFDKTSLAVRVLATATLMGALFFSIPGRFPAHGQGIDPLAQQLANDRVTLEQLNFQRQSDEITAAEYQTRYNQLGADIQNLLHVQIGAQSRERQAQIAQQSESLFQVRIVPLRQQWQRALAEKQQRDAKQNIEIRNALNAEGERAGKLQAERALLAEKLQKHEISQAEFQQNDAAAEQQVLVLQRKYDALGNNWGRLFSQVVAADAQKSAAQLQQQERSVAARSSFEKDARRAADITLSLDRDQFFVQNRSMTPQEQQQRAASKLTELAGIVSRYKGPASAELKNRVTLLVNAEVKDKTAQWREEIQKAREASNQPVPVPSPKPAVRTTLPPQTEPPIPPPPPPPDNSLTEGSLAALSVLLAGAGGYYFYQKRRQAPATPAYSGLKASLPVSLPPAAPTPAPAPRPASPVAVAPAPTANSTAGATTGMKDKLFAKQREKYQASYNDAADELTRVSTQLSQMGSVLAGIQNNLKLLSKTVSSHVGALVQARYSNIRTIAANAARFKPLYRFFRKAGIIVKILISVPVLFFLLRSIALVRQGLYLVVLVTYVFLFMISFFFERRALLKTHTAVLKRDAEQLKAMSLAYVSDSQAASAQSPGAGYRVLRVSPEDKNQPFEEYSLSPNSWGTEIGPDTYLLYVGKLAVYRVTRNGDYSLVFADQASEFNRIDGSLLSLALSEQKSFAKNTLDPLAEYAKTAWRKRAISAEVPRLEKLVQNIERLESVWHQTYVSDKVFEFLLRRIDLFNVADPATPSGIFLYGYPGNGKAHLARKIAESVSARFEQINPATLNSADVVKTLWEKSRGKDPVVLFVDYAEHVFPRMGSENQGSGTREATLAWITEWARMEPRQSRVWVIMTAQNDSELHPGILSQFGGSKIEVEAPDDAGRELILKAACRDNQMLPLLPDWLVSALGQATVRELRDIVKETKMQCVPNAPDDAHWRLAVVTTRGSDENVDKTKTWDRLILPADIKDQLKRACRALRQADRYRAKGVDVPNILLFGPPGTGKTEIARTVANESGAKFFMAGTADVKGEYIGQSAPRVRDLFAKARAKAPAVLFIDEFETLAGKRDSSQTDSFGKDIVTQMLAEMDGARVSDRPVFVLAATNFPELIDVAMLDRFRQIEIGLPDESARCEILKGAIRSRSVDPTLDIDEISALLAKKTSRKSGRDLVHLVANAMARVVDSSDSVDDACLTRESLVNEVTPQGRAVSDSELEKVWTQIVLKPQVKEYILAKIRMFNGGDKAAPRGLLLYGPTGTGKTEIARRIADSTNSHFMALKGSDLKSSNVAGSAQSVRKVWEEARARERCIIFVDECDAIFGRRGSVDTDAASNEAVPEFLASWDGMESAGQVWVVGATNHRERLDEAIVGRFGAAVEIGMPEAPERLEILRLEMRKLERAVEVPDSVGAMTTGLAGRNLSYIAKDVCALAEERKSDITPEIWKTVILRYAKDGNPAVDEGARWDTLVVSQDTLEKLQTLCESLRYMESLRKQGFEPSRGALLYGPPGTGKTQIARTIANESGLPFIAAKLSDIKAGFLGQCAQKVKELFERARSKAPCILFIDEIDAGAVERTSPKADALTNEIVTQMLAEMEGIEKNDRPVFLLGAANHPELIDAAIKSRFVDMIEVPNPDARQRQQLLKIMLAKKPVDFDIEQVSSELAALTGEVSGRDLSHLVDRASRKALQRALKTGTADHVVIKRDDLSGQLQTTFPAA
jgi:SpoVK/Ycf46/Vps4 family AAA+-type ATPase